MVYHPILLSIWTRCEACVTYTVCLYAPLAMTLPNKSSPKTFKTIHQNIRKRVKKTYLLQRILIKHTPLIILPPIPHIHRILANQLQQPQAIIPIITSCSGVDDKVLAGDWVDELFGAFVGGEARAVEGVGFSVGCHFPGVGGDGEDGAFGEVGGDCVGV